MDKIGKLFIDGSKMFFLSICEKRSMNTIVVKGDKVLLIKLYYTVISGLSRMVIGIFFYVLQHLYFKSNIKIETKKV
jgi:hypothetical protein